MNRARRAAALLALIPLLARCAPSSIPPYAPERAAAPTRHVIVISIDGLRADAIEASGA